jgi:hypothetical protein
VNVFGVMFWDFGLCVDAVGDDAACAPVGTRLDIEGVQGNGVRRWSSVRRRTSMSISLSHGLISLPA